MDDHGAELSGPGYVLLNDQALENEECKLNADLSYPLCRYV